MKRILLCSLAALFVGRPVDAATLLTSDGGYTGPALQIASDMTDYVLTAGPARLPGGITFSSNFSESGYGLVAPGLYPLTGNGFVDGPLVFANQPFPTGTTATVTLTFDTAVASFGALFNYGADYQGTTQTFFDGIHPTISAYDVHGDLIGSYDLATLAPIVSPGGTNAFGFRGIDGDGRLIKSFSFGGAAIVARATIADAGPVDPVTPVPETGSWMLMMTGFAAIGATQRYRRAIGASRPAA